MKPGIDTPAWAQALRSLWQQRSARERRWVLATAILFAPLMAWQWALAPAWSVWREAPVRQAQLDQQTRQMLQWQVQAQRLQAPERIGRPQALERLQAGADRLLGSGAQLQAQGEQLRVTLQGATAAGLAQWLALARDQAQTLPQQAQLERRSAAADGASENVTWQGSLLLRLP